jgi:thiol:disulfide interchange protein
MSPARIRPPIFCARLLFAGLVAVGLSSAGCSPDAPPETDANTAAAATAYDAPFRTEAELATAIDVVCRASTRQAQPLLLEFSAAWCSDCRALQTMKRDPTLALELEAWPRLTVNVGRFDRHRDLLATLGVKSIAHWAVLAPEDCTAPVGTWPRQAQRTLEVSSGEARHLTPEDLARWLADLRTA